MEIQISEKVFKVLIVDDNPKNVQLLGNVLVDNKCQVSYALNGKQALDRIKENKFDLILLDIMMPEMDGYEVCEKIKEKEENKDIPIIFITARAEKENIVKGLKMVPLDNITNHYKI